MSKLNSLIQEYNLRCQYSRFQQEFTLAKAVIRQHRCKTFSILNSVEHEIFLAHKRLAYLSLKNVAFLDIFILMSF